MVNSTNLQSNFEKEIVNRPQKITSRSPIAGKKFQTMSKKRSRFFKDHGRNLKLVLLRTVPKNVHGIANNLPRMQRVSSATVPSQFNRLLDLKELKCCLYFPQHVLKCSIHLFRKQEDQTEFRAERPTEVLNWPSSYYNFGQISGVAVDLAGNPVVFHRGEIKWDRK